MGLANSYRAMRAARYIVPAVLLVAIASIVFDQVRGPVDEGVRVEDGETYDLIHVCPSARWTLEGEAGVRGLLYAEERLLEACIGPPPILEDDCKGEPPDGVLQLRDHRDQVVEWTAAVNDALVDQGIRRRDLDTVTGELKRVRGVYYVLEPHNIRPCTIEHVLAHAAGVVGPSPTGHVTAPTSVFAERCGDAYHHLDQCTPP